MSAWGRMCTDREGLVGQLSPAVSGAPATCRAACTAMAPNRRECLFRQPFPGPSMLSTARGVRCGRHRGRHSVEKDDSSSPAHVP